MHVTAINLKPGDEIVGQDRFPNSLYCGTVASTVVVDAGVQINLTDGHYTRPENTVFEIRRAAPEHQTRVERSVFRTDHWQAQCSCGWRGDLRPREIEAQDEAEVHSDMAITP